MKVFPNNEVYIYGDVEEAKRVFEFRKTWLLLPEIAPLSSMFQRICKQNIRPCSHRAALAPDCKVPGLTYRWQSWGSSLGHSWLSHDPDITPQPCDHDRHCTGEFHCLQLLIPAQCMETVNNMGSLQLSKYSCFPPPQFISFNRSWVLMINTLMKKLQKMFLPTVIKRGGDFQKQRPSCLWAVPDNAELKWMGWSYKSMQCHLL